MASATKDLEDLVNDLLDPATGWDLRQEFHQNPFLVMDNYKLDRWEQALLFTMDRDFIISNTEGLKHIIQSYQMGSAWPEQGLDWKNKQNAPEDIPKFLKDLAWKPVPPPPASTGGAVPFGAIGRSTAGPGGWSDPGPHGRGFYPTSAPLVPAGTPPQPKHKVRLHLVGEGYLPSAEIVFRKQDIGFSKTVFVEAMHAANFRRIYLKTEEFAATEDERWETGHYEVLVRNEPQLDYWLDAGLLFEVKAGP